MHATIKSFFILGVALLTVPAVGVDQLPSAAPENAHVYIIAPADGAVITSPITIKFGLSGMGVAPAGVIKEATGHHHLLIDMTELPALNASLPSNENVRHFGGGQTEVVIDLPAGKHSLQLLLGDHLHRPHNPALLSEKITITISGEAP